VIRIRLAPVCTELLDSNPGAILDTDPDLDAGLQNKLELSKKTFEKLPFILFFIIGMQTIFSLPAYGLEISNIKKRTKLYHCFSFNVAVDLDWDPDPDFYSF